MTKVGRACLQAAAVDATFYMSLSSCSVTGGGRASLSRRASFSSGHSFGVGILRLEGKVRLALLSEDEPRSLTFDKKNIATVSQFVIFTSCAREDVCSYDEGFRRLPARGDTADA